MAEISLICEENLLDTIFHACDTQRRGTTAQTRAFIDRVRQFRPPAIWEWQIKSEVQMEKILVRLCVFLCKKKKAELSRIVLTTCLCRL